MQSFAREIGEGENRSAWTSRDPEAIAAYDNDPMMNFTPSSRHWFDHAKFIKSRAQVSNIAKVRPDLPILPSPARKTPWARTVMPCGRWKPIIGQRARPMSPAPSPRGAPRVGQRHRQSQVFGDRLAWLATGKVGAGLEPSHPDRYPLPSPCGFAMLQGRRIDLSSAIYGSE